MNIRTLCIFGVTLLLFATIGCVPEAGLSGGVSIENEGSRYYSGATINAGTIDGLLDLGFDGSKVLLLSLLNETTQPLTITAVGGTHVAPTFGSVLTEYSFLYSWETGELGAFEVTQDIGSTTISAGESLDFTVAFDVSIGDYAFYGRRESRQGYAIALDDGVGGSYDFVFEVYGVVAC